MVLALNLAVCWDLFINQDNQQVTQKDFKPMRNLNDCAPENISNSPRQPNMLGSYLAGLIEGDGTIVVDERNSKGRLNYASIQMAFAAKDFPLITILAQVIGHGSISKRKIAAAYIYTINNASGLIKIFNLLNGKIRGPKVEDLQQLINYLNRKYPELGLEIYDIDKSPINQNP